MRTPEVLRALVEDGFVDAVLRPLQSGKEAQVYIVMAGGEQRIAKIYKTAEQRNFKNRAEYQEGRGTRNTRDQRAMKRRSSYGRSRDEDAWQSTEVDMIRRLAAAGVRVPEPHFFGDGVLIMELVQDADGEPAPRLGDLRVSPEDAVAIHDALLRDVVRMLCAGVVHGDLSEFNVLVDEDGPVIIDLPQAVDASSNPNARKLLLRDVENLERFITRWVPGRSRRQYAAEMWSLYEVNELEPDTELTGEHEASKEKASTDDLLGLIADAEEDETMRRLGRGERSVSVGRDAAGRRVLVNEDPEPRDPRRRESAKAPAGGPTRRKDRPKKKRQASPVAPQPSKPPSKAPSHAEVIARAMAAAKAAAEAPPRADAREGHREGPRDSERAAQRGRSKSERRDRPSPARPERPERPERSERPERPERPERSERSERPERPERPEQPQRRDAKAKDGAKRRRRRAGGGEGARERPARPDAEGARSPARRRRRKPDHPDGATRKEGDGSSRRAGATKDGPRRDASRPAGEGTGPASTRRDGGRQGGSSREPEAGTSKRRRRRRRSGGADSGPSPRRGDRPRND